MTPSESKPRRVPVADLKPLRHLRRYRAAAPGAEPDPGELVAPLRAGRQPYPVVVADTTVVFGMNLVEAAAAAGRSALGVVECPGGAGLEDGDLGLKAAGLHLAAVVRRTDPDPFDVRLIGARVYEVWSHLFEHRPPRRRDDARTAAWAAARAALIKDAFGRAQRSLVRDVRLLHLPGALLCSVRRGLVPESHVEAAAGLGHAAQLDLARRLSGGEVFAGIRDDFFPPAGPRKTACGAARAIRACVRTIAAEAGALKGRSPLAAGDYAAARAAVAGLQSWLDAPPPRPLGELIAAAARDLGAAATRGGGRAPTIGRGGRARPGPAGSAPRCGGRPPTGGRA